TPSSEWPTRFTRGDVRHPDEPDTGPVIEDLDETQPAARHGRRMRALSIVLAAAAVAGYAVAASPLSHGPFAEPRPSAAAIVFTPAPFASVEPAAAHAATGGCTVPGTLTNATVFINGRTVQVPSVPRPTSAFSSCVGF